MVVSDGANGVDIRAVVRADAKVTVRTPSTSLLQREGSLLTLHALVEKSADTSWVAHKATESILLAETYRRNFGISIIVLENC